MHIRDFWSFIFAHANISRSLFAREIAIINEESKRQRVEPLMSIIMHAASRGCTIMLGVLLDGCSLWYSQLADVTVRACKGGQFETTRMLFAREKYAHRFVYQPPCTIKRSLAYYGFIGACKGGHIELLDAICACARKNENIADNNDEIRIYEPYDGACLIVNAVHSYGTAGNLAALCYNNARVREYFANCGEKYGPILSDKDSWAYVIHDILLKSRDFEYFLAAVNSSKEAYDMLPEVIRNHILSVMVRKEAHYGEELICKFIKYMNTRDLIDFRAQNGYTCMTIILPQLFDTGGMTTMVHRRTVYYAARALAREDLLAIAASASPNGIAPDGFCEIMHRYGANQLVQVNDLFGFDYFRAPDGYYKRMLDREST